MKIIAKNAICNVCNQECNYYDYLAHSETCNQYTNMNTNMDTNIHIENSNSNSNYNNMLMGYETDNELNDNPIARTFSLPNLYNSYKLNYPSATHNPNTNRNSILEELMNNSINNLTHQLNNININNSISRNDLYKYSNKIYLQLQYECAICIETHNIGTEYLIFKCGHLFCLNCSNRWFEYKPICPLCKQDIRL